MSIPYEVYAYSGKTLLNLIGRFPEADLTKHNSISCRDLEAKSHMAYFESYFGYMNAKTIVVEKQYVDRDFLDDFAGYYVRCFADYGRICSRFHFFQDAFEQPEIDKLFELALPSNIVDSLKDSYLGFIVVKPLPETVIGRTCLKHYPCDERRYFPITRNYEANLLGVRLNVKTLAFQEQDNTVSACATSALWSVLQGTAILFHHKMLSPIEITNASVLRYPIETRAIPNNGLTAEQMADAIRSVGLEPFVINASDELVLKRTLYGYLRGGIPILMGIRLEDVCTAEVIGLHAIAVTGYSLGGTNDQNDNPELRLIATKMDKLYAHDDQVGPFCRMAFVEDTETQNWHLTTSFQSPHGNRESLRVRPLFIMVPLYNKIRIPYGTVHEVIHAFDRCLLEFGQGSFERLEWEIFLTTVNELKSSVFEHTAIELPINRKDILHRRLPRFIWRARAYSVKGAAFDLLFDATDIEQGSFVVGDIKYDEEFMSMLLPFVKVLFERRQHFPILRHILQHLCSS